MMNAAIAQLEISLEALENNEPINRKEGNEEQADLEAKNAEEIRQALVILTGSVRYFAPPVLASAAQAYSGALEIYSKDATEEASKRLEQASRKLEQAARAYSGV